MTTIDIYKAHYEEVCSWHDDEYDKYEWAANYIFDLTTYDAALDEKFVKDILEVCQVIIDNYNYEYIEKEENYIKYILVCQLLNNFNWIDWGISIRGAWFNLSKTSDSKVILEELEWGQYDEETGKYEKCKLEAVPFSRNNLQDLIKFMEDKN
jgi:hypothetical protein